MPHQAADGFSFVSGWRIPDNTLVVSRPVLSIRACNGFDISADERNDFPVGQTVFNVPYDVF
jgi:hypothetical protein